MPELSEKIKKLRQQKSWTQIQAAQTCDINPSIWSRIESGTIPTMATLKKIAEGFDVPLNELLTAAYAPPQVRVGFAHCIWAAPIIPLVMEGPTLQGIQLTSYGDFQPADSFSYQPHWHDSEDKTEYYTGPNLTEKKSINKSLAGYRDWPEGEKKSPYSAADLDWLLTNQRIDCVVAAENVFSEIDSRLIRCARIMDCVGSGAAILVWKDDGRFSTTLSTLKSSQPLIMLEQLVKALSENEFVIPTFYVKGTTSEKALDYFGAGGGVPEKKQVLFEKKPVLIRDWGSVTSELDKALTDSEAFLFLGWEPFISYLKNKYNPAPGISNMTRIHMSREKPLPYLSFDIMFTKSHAKTWAESSFVTHFLRQLAVNIERLKKAIAIQQQDSQIVSQVASYLNMDREVCLRALSHLDFGLLYYPEWLDFKSSVLQ